MAEAHGGPSPAALIPFAGRGNGAVCRPQGGREAGTVAQPESLAVIFAGRGIGLVIGLEFGLEQQKIIRNVYIWELGDLT